MTGPLHAAEARHTSLTHALGLDPPQPRPFYQACCPCGWQGPVHLYYVNDTVGRADALSLAQADARGHNLA